MGLSVFKKSAPAFPIDFGDQNRVPLADFRHVDRLGRWPHGRNDRSLLRLHDGPFGEQWKAEQKVGANLAVKHGDAPQRRREDYARIVYVSSGIRSRGCPQSDAVSRSEGDEPYRIQWKRWHGLLISTQK